MNLIIPKTTYQDLSATRTTDSFKELTLFSRSDAAKVMSIGKDALAVLISEGKIGTIQVGDREKIAYTEILKYIEENTVRVNQMKEEEHINLETFRSTLKTISKTSSKDILKNVMEEFNG
ncbi:MAG: MerR family transcriptional regulator [Melioribacteraceae bacterium]